MEKFEQVYQNTPVPSSKTDYYWNAEGRRIADFCLGLFGSYILVVAMFIFSTGLFSVMEFSIAFVQLMEILMTIIPLIFLIAMIVLSFSKGRRYIGIGIISSVVLPLLLFGACLIVIGGMSL